MKKSLKRSRKKSLKRSRKKSLKRSRKKSLKRSSKRSYSPLSTIIFGSLGYIAVSVGLGIIIYYDKKTNKIYSLNKPINKNSIPTIKKVDINSIRDINSVNNWIYNNFKKSIVNYENIKYEKESILEIFGKKYNCVNELKELKIIFTIGDGTCLIHAFLFSVSKNYRKLNNDKKIVGQEFRKQVLSILCQGYISNNENDYLTDTAIKCISLIYNINFLIFENYENFENCIISIVENGENNKWLIIYCKISTSGENDYSHFSSVGKNGKYLFDKKELQSIIDCNRL